MARIYDAALGGNNNFASDRAKLEEMDRLSPYIVRSMIENRYFLGRVVRHMAEAGVRQFLDIGAGLPTQGNVHEVAQRIAPTARVIYVDHDPIVLAHARALMANDDKVHVVAGDVRRIDDLLNDVASHIDWQAPVGVLMIAILHFVTDEHDPHGILATIRERLAPGSYLALSHGSRDGFEGGKNLPRGRVNAVEKGYDEASEPLVLRPYGDIERMFTGFDLLAPGVVRVPFWRPDGMQTDLEPALCGTFGGLGRLRVG